GLRRTRAREDIFPGGGTDGTQSDRVDGLPVSPAKATIPTFPKTATDDRGKRYSFDGLLSAVAPKAGMVQCNLVVNLRKRKLRQREGRDADPETKIREHGWLPKINTQLIFRSRI